MVEVLSLARVAESAAQPRLRRVRPAPRRAVDTAAPRSTLPALLTVGEPRPAAHSLAKRWFDRSCAALGLIVLLPFLLLVALAIRVQSDGPALYRQQRIGLGGKSFTIWKFRTMNLDADAHLHGLLRHHGRAGAPLFKVPHDPRITGLGRSLRRYSIDELPQLVNVLRGEMSLIGPRPQRPDEVALYRPEHVARLQVRPGLTGLWQVHGRSELGWDDAVQLDLQYVHHWSLGLDARILARTARVVLRADGAV